MHLHFPVERQPVALCEEQDAHGGELLETRRHETRIPAQWEFDLPAPAWAATAAPFRLMPTLQPGESGRFHSANT